MLRNTQHIFLGLILLFSFFSFYHSVGALTLTPSQTISVSAIIGSIPTIDESGGGSSGSIKSGVKFSGFAYPYATITLQRSLTKVTTIVADATGAFSLVVPEDQQQLFTLFATDIEGRRSTLLNFPTAVYSGYLTDISSIRFAPTIATDKLSVKTGDYLTIFGAALPAVPLQITISGPEQTTFTLTADDGGHYSITAPLSVGAGEYTIKINYIDDKRTSRVVRLIVGSTTVYQVEATTNIPGDCNVDQKITIVDFSVLAYWYGKKNPPVCVDLNKDGVITLVDFSILAFYWNG
jgi:hypothetical protein